MPDALVHGADTWPSRYHERMTASQNRVVQRVLLGIGVVLLALRFVHLSADFPNHCRWHDDWARYTDEGWYASGAIHKALLGHWLVPYDFNPIVTIPGWPLLLHILFHFTGVSLVAARAVDAAFSVVASVLLALLVARSRPRWGMLAFLLMASSPIVFVFSRLALLEVPVMAFVLAALLAAPLPGQKSVLRSVLCGTLLLAAVLVKSTAVFLIVAVCGYIIQQHRIAKARRPWVSPRTTLIVFTAGMCLYTLIVVHPHMVDFNTLKSQNGFTFNRESWEKLARAFYRALTWTDPVLYPLALLATGAACTRLPSIRRDPLFPLATLWGAGVILFAVSHVDAGPRYFALLAVPVVVLTVLLLDALSVSARSLYRPALAVVGVATLLNLGYIARLMARPTYTMVQASHDMAALIHASGDAHPLVFGHGAEESTFFTHIEAVDDIGSIPPASKLDLYHPGWAAVWSDDQTLSRPEIASRYRAVPVQSWAVMDDPLRSHLLLFRLQQR